MLLLLKYLLLSSVVLSLKTIVQNVCSFYTKNKFKT